MSMIRSGRIPSDLIKKVGLIGRDWSAIITGFIPAQHGRSPHSGCAARVPWAVETAKKLVALRRKV